MSIKDITIEALADLIAEKVAERLGNTGPVESAPAKSTKTLLCHWQTPVVNYAAFNAAATPSTMSSADMQETLFALFAQLFGALTGSFRQKSDPFSSTTAATTFRQRSTLRTSCASRSNCGRR